MYPGSLTFVTAMVTLLLVAGCRGRALIPSPNLYVNSPVNPYEEVPASFQTNEVDVLFATDRRRAEQKNGTIAYDHGRSQSLAFGSATVLLGENETSWDELVTASRTHERDGEFSVSVVRVAEQERFPETPFPLVESEDNEAHDRLQHDPSVIAKNALVADALRAEVRRRLEKTPRKHAYVFIHGYNNTFDDAVAVAAQVWHFLPRMGIPIAYSWPAGRGGLRGYFYDRESGEFTIFHLKEFLRILASIDELEKVHLVAHSRGTDVTMTALRELWIEMRERGIQNPGRPRKLGHVIVAAPDLDLDVISQRVGAEEIVRQLEHITVYMSKSDVAIGFSTWLFVSQSRMGRIDEEDLARLGENAVRRGAVQRNISLIDARIDSGFIGHSYFYSHPAVLSDLILILRDDRLPGAEHGRPLQKGSLFWSIHDAYPASE